MLRQRPTLNRGRHVRSNGAHAGLRRINRLRTTGAPAAQHSIPAAHSDSASVAVHKPSSGHVIKQQATSQVSVHQAYGGHTDLERLLTPADSGMHSAPIMAGSLMAMAYLAVAGRPEANHSRSGLLLEMASPHARHVPSAHPSLTMASAVTPAARQPAPGPAPAPAPTAVLKQSKEAELAAALQVAQELEAQVTALAGDVREREEQLNGMQESAKTQATVTKGALRESQRKVALLEAMVKALRERLSSEEARTTALSAEVVAGQEALVAADSARREAEARVLELKHEVAVAMGLLAQAEARSLALESRVAELTATSEQLRSRVMELEKELASQAAAAAHAAREAEQRVLAIQASATAEAEAAAALKAQLAAREAELEEAKEKLDKSKREADELMEKSKHQAQEQFNNQLLLQAHDVSVAMEEAMALVADREAQVAELKVQLEQAADKSERLVASKAAELASVRGGLEAALAAARQEVDTSNQQLAQMRAEVELVLHADLAVLVAGSSPQGAGQAGAVATAWQNSQAATELRHLTSRQMQLSQEIQARSQALEEQAQQVYPLLQGPVAAQSLALRTRHSELVSQLQEAEARWEADGSGMQAVSRLRRDVASVSAELAGLLRTVMSGPQRQRERALRAELGDRETELRGITAQISRLRQQAQPLPSGAAAAGNAAQVLQAVSVSGQLPAALAQRLRELLKQRDAEAAAAAKAREAALERTSKEREQAAVRAAQEREAAQLAQIRAKEQALVAEQQRAAKERKAEVAAVEAQYRQQLEATKADLAIKVRDAEAAWRKQLEAAQQTALAADSDRQRLAAEVAMGSVQARQQLSELAAVREELAARSRQLLDVKATYETSKKSVERRAAGAAAEAALVAGQVALLQKALQAREVEVNRLKTLQQNLPATAQAAATTPTPTRPAPAITPPSTTSDQSPPSPAAKPDAPSTGITTAAQPPPAPSSPTKALDPRLAGGRELFAPSTQPPQHQQSAAPPAPWQPPSELADKKLSDVAAFLEASKSPSTAAPTNPSDTPSSPSNQAGQNGAPAATPAAPAAASPSLSATTAAGPAPGTSAAANTTYPRPPSVRPPVSVRPSSTAAPSKPSPETSSSSDAATSTSASSAAAVPESPAQPSAPSITATAPPSVTSTSKVAPQPDSSADTTAAEATAAAGAPTKQGTSSAAPSIQKPSPSLSGTKSTSAAASTSNTSTSQPQAAPPAAAPPTPTPSIGRPLPPTLPSSSWGQPKTPAGAPSSSTTDSTKQPAASTTTRPSPAQPAAPTPAPAAPAPAAPASAFPDVDDLSAEITRITQSLVSRQQQAAQNTPSATRAPTPQRTSAPGTPAQKRLMPLQLLSSGYMMPHTAKVERGGEDAFFVSNVGADAFGVTDGVGGWAADGVDVAAYARGICEVAAAAIKDTAGAISSQAALQQAQEAIKLPGSCTACVAILRPGQKVLEVANVGDSGVRLLRGGRVIGGTAVQEHAFNMPYQLADMDSFPETDTAMDAQLYSFPVQDGDVAIMATDGLWDNLWDEQLVSIVSQSLPPGGSRPTAATAALIASRLTKAAHIAARDTNARTPWAVESAAASGSIMARLFPRGGKMDDITVVAAVVVGDS